VEGSARAAGRTLVWMVLLTVLLVLVGRVLAGTGGMIVFLAFAAVMNGVAYWFSDRGLLLIILAPIAAALIQLAVSRSREYEADHTGGRGLWRSDGAPSALRKLERATQVIASQTAQPAFAHLYIVNPLSGRTLSTLFCTHPPLEERIRRLEAMAAGIRR
jgi:heat shock protein HtpX